MPARAWFPTYVYESALLRKGNDAFAESLRSACQEVRDQDSEGQRWCSEHYPAGYTSYGTRRNLHRTVAAFVELERKIWPHVSRFARRLDMDLREAQLAMTDCWVNFMSQGASHPLHLHPGAVVSGSFYVCTPPGCSGIRFEDPRLEQAMGAPPRRADCRPENLQRVSYDVDAGKLVLFQSFLKHEVASNPVPSERVSVSFNYTWV